MTKSFKFNENNKIELSKEQLKSLLDQAYWEGYRDGSKTTWIYTTPDWTPYTWTSTSTTVSNNKTITDTITTNNSSNSTIKNTGV